MVITTTACKRALRDIAVPAVLCLMLQACSRGDATNDVDPTAYADGSQLKGDIRIWGSPADGDLLQSLQTEFQRRNPKVRFRDSLYGPESTMAGLYNGVADIAFLAREMRLPVENMAFEWVYQHKPVQIDIANSGIASGRPSDNIAFYVRKDNPLDRITLPQLRAILGAEAPAQSLRTWGQLGLEGQWKNKPIAVYGPQIDDVSALFVRTHVMANSRKWNADYREHANGAEALGALAKDALGIGFGPLSPARADIKPLAIAADADKQYFLPMRDTIISGKYPLRRQVTFAINRTPGKAIAPELHAFLAFVLSEHGQALIAKDGAYLPLAKPDLDAQLKKIR